MAEKVAFWIEVALLCETVGCLPNPGGLFQQNRNHVKLLVNVYRARDAADREKLKKQQHVADAKNLKDPGGD